MRITPSIVADLAANPVGGWPPEIQAEMVDNALNPCVGTRLLSVDKRVRVWEIRLRPGERIPFHCHVLDYFWTAVTSGRAISHISDGTVVEATYAEGQTEHHIYGSGEFKVHDLQNIGEAELVFTTVEFLDSANKPLELSEATLAFPR